MRHVRKWLEPVAVSLLLAAVACNQSERTRANSAAGAIDGNARAALSVVDVDMGRHVDAER